MACSYFKYKWNKWKLYKGYKTSWSHDEPLSNIVRQINMLEWRTLS